LKGNILLNEKSNNQIRIKRILLSVHISDFIEFILLKVLVF
jgi:hypothetical protein